MDPVEQERQGSQIGHLGHLLPSVWPGYVLAVSALIVEVGEGIFDPNSVTDQYTLLFLLVSLVNSSYWIFCIFRIHRVLAEASNGSYPIGPWKAVGLMFIPFFNLYWLFRWTNQIADFVNGQPGTARLLRNWPAGFLLLGLIITAKIDGSLGMPILYGTLHFIRNKLAPTLSPNFRIVALAVPPQPQDVGPRRLAVSAAIGSAFGFILWQAIKGFSAEPHPDQVKELVVIALVTVGILGFLEPLLHALSSWFGIPEAHMEALQGKRTTRRLIAVFFLVAFASISHALLHLITANDPLGVAVQIIYSLIPGGITYAWTRGVLRWPSRCAPLGAVWGAFLGIGITFVYFIILSVLAGGKQNRALVDLEFLALAGSIAWPLMGFAGGLMLDKHRGLLPSRSAAKGIITGILAFEVLNFVAIQAGVFDRFGQLGLQDIAAIFPDDLSRAAGWTLGLIVMGQAADQVLGAQIPVPLELQAD
jgi:hypothetical protein